MPQTAPFEAHTDRYEQWFETYEGAYRSELAALERFVPSTGRSVEIGVGSGRFARPLDVDVGVDPAGEMLALAADRDVEAVRGVAEHLPFHEDAFETALLVTTICFVDDVAATLAEADRVLAPSGRLVIGYVDEDSPLGRRYREEKADNPFYRDATFVSTDDLVGQLDAAGFTEIRFAQTLFDDPAAVEEPEPVESGYGEGSFVAVEATR